MRKEPGVYLIELYDELGHKFNTVVGKNLADSQFIGDQWCDQSEGYSAVVQRVVYNTKFPRATYV